MTITLTSLLHAASADDPESAKRLFEFMYADLKRLARSNLRKSNNLDELNTTMLVHESFLKYVEHGSLANADRGAFFAYVGRVMRSVVVDFVRERQAQKRGGGVACVVISAAHTHASNPFEIRNCVVERCVLDTPSPNNSTNPVVTAIAFSSEVGCFHKSCVIRNCLITS